MSDQTVEITIRISRAAYDWLQGAEFPNGDSGKCSPEEVAAAFVERLVEDHAGYDDDDLPF